MEEQKINVCRALASIFGEDATDQEISFVGRAALDLGLDESALKLVLQAVGTVTNTKAVLETVVDPGLRRFLFRRVVAATLLDDSLTEAEKIGVEQIVGAFGWDKATAEEYIEFLQKFIEMERKGEEILSRLG